METKASIGDRTAAARALTDAERVLVLERQLAEAKDALCFLAYAGLQQVIERYRTAVLGGNVPAECLTYFDAVRGLAGDAALEISLGRSEESIRREYLVSTAG